MSFFFFFVDHRLLKGTIRYTSFAFASSARNDASPLNMDYYVIAPYLRGYGTTYFLSGETLRNGQQSALALDVINLIKNECSKALSQHTKPIERLRGEKTFCISSTPVFSEYLIIQAKNIYKARQLLNLKILQKILFL